jgi:hypothetical protein
VFPNLRRMHKYWILPFRKPTLFLFPQLLSCFVEKKYFHGKMGTCKIGADPHITGALRFFCSRRNPSKYEYIEIKRELFPCREKLQCKGIAEIGTHKASGSHLGVQLFDFAKVVKSVCVCVFFSVKFVM